MIMHIKTTTNDYSVKVVNKLEACKLLQTLHHMGIVCISWRYTEEESECSETG